MKAQRDDVPRIGVIYCLVSGGHLHPRQIDFWSIKGRRYAAYRYGVIWHFVYPHAEYGDIPTDDLTSDTFYTIAQDPSFSHASEI